VLADHVGIHVSWAHSKSFGQVHAEAKTIKIRAGADHAVVACQVARKSASGSGGSVVTSSTVCGATSTIRGIMSSKTFAFASSRRNRTERIIAISRTA